jgi:hypothetical protein
MVAMTQFMMEERPFYYSVFAWFKHSIFIFFWIFQSQIKKKFTMYSQKVVENLIDFEEVTNSKVILYQNKNEVDFYFPVVDFDKSDDSSKDHNLQIKEEEKNDSASNYDKKDSQVENHFKIFKFVSKSENDLNDILNNDQSSQKVKEKINFRMKKNLLITSTPTMTLTL